MPTGVDRTVRAGDFSPALVLLHELAPYGSRAGVVRKLLEDLDCHIRGPAPEKPTKWRTFHRDDRTHVLDGDVVVRACAPDRARQTIKLDPNVLCGQHQRTASIAYRYFHAWVAHRISAPAPEEAVDDAPSGGGLTKVLREVAEPAEPLLKRWMVHEDLETANNVEPALSLRRDNAERTHGRAAAEVAARLALGDLR